MILPSTLVYPANFINHFVPLRSIFNLSMSDSDTKSNQVTPQPDALSHDNGVNSVKQSSLESTLAIVPVVVAPKVRRQRVGRTLMRRAPRTNTSNAPEVLDEKPSLPFDTTVQLDSRKAVESVFEHVLSGEYDHLEVDVLSAKPASVFNLENDSLVPALDKTEDVEVFSGQDSTKRVLAPDSDVPKIQKVLAQAGIGSRRDLEQMISDGRITVNGQIAHIGQRIGRRDRIQVDGKPVHLRVNPGRCRVLAYHKPVGEVVTYSDPQQRPTVFRRLPFLAHGKWQSVGRLDLNTEGLLLFTNFGELANRLMHPRFGLEREYAVRVLGRLSEENRKQLLSGVDIEGQCAAFSQITDGGGEGANHWYRVVIHEGRNREVRKLFDTVGLAVSRLIRIRYGSVVLPRGLKRSGWIDLTPDDIEHLFSVTGLVNSARIGSFSRGERRTQVEQATTNSMPPNSKTKQPSPRSSREFIPNPLQQTYDQRAFKADQRRPRHRIDDEGPIPNPLIQNFDKRAVQGGKPFKRSFNENFRIPDPLQQTYDKREHLPRSDYFDDDLLGQEGQEGPIPNPLQQTYDQRLNPRSNKPKSSKTSGRGINARNRNSQDKAISSEFSSKPRERVRGSSMQPDPMRTSVGYVGGDAVLGNKAKSNRRLRRR